MAGGRSKGGTNRKYSPEFKIQVVESIEKGNLSVRESCRFFGIFLASGYENTCPVRRWRRIYLEEGPEGLFRERRGQSGKQGRISRKLPKNVEEDLIGRVQRLEMENEYLKKLDALVRRRERSAKKSPK